MVWDAEGVSRARQCASWHGQVAASGLRPQNASQANMYSVLLSEALRPNPS